MNKPVCVEDIDWDKWDPVDRATLLFVIRNGEILLIHKKRGLGAGKINGPGGRIEPGEEPHNAAIREVQEELLVTPTGVGRAGELSFQFLDGYSIHACVFRANDCKGKPRETEEAIPLWVPIEDIPYDRMWADDRIWMPYLLEKQFFSGRFIFDEDSMIDYALELE